MAKKRELGEIRSCLGWKQLFLFCFGARGFAFRLVFELALIHASAGTDRLSIHFLGEQHVLSFFVRLQALSDQFPAVFPSPCWRVYVGYVRTTRVDHSPINFQDENLSLLRAINCLCFCAGRFGLFTGSWRLLYKLVTGRSTFESKFLFGKLRRAS